VPQVADRCDDLLELRQCLQGVKSEMERGNYEAAALHVTRFHALEATLPVHEGEAAEVAADEAAMRDAVLARFHAAIHAHRRLAEGGGTAATPTPAGAAAGEATPTAAQIDATIGECCQIMSLLGHADECLKQYMDFLHSKLAGDCLAELRTLALTSSVEEPGAAAAALTALLTHAHGALRTALGGGGGGGGGSGEGSRAGSSQQQPAFKEPRMRVLILASVHGACDRQAGRLVASFAHSGRVKAALEGRKSLSAKAAKAAAAAAAAAAAGRPPPAVNQPIKPDRSNVSAAAAAEFVKRVENADNGKPLASLDPQSGPTFEGVDYSYLPAYDALLEEVVAMLQVSMPISMDDVKYNSVAAALYRIPPPY
jgi:hypothetical protein